MKPLRHALYCKNRLNKYQKNVTSSKCNGFMYVQSKHVCRSSRRMHSERENGDKYIENASHNCNKKKKKKLPYRNFIIAALLFYGSYEGISLIQNNVYIKKNIEKYRKLNDLIDIDIVPLKIYFDTKVNILKEWLVVNTQNTLGLINLLTPMRRIILTYYDQCIVIVNEKLRGFSGMLFPSRREKPTVEQNSAGKEKHTSAREERKAMVNEEGETVVNEEGKTVVNEEGKTVVSEEGKAVVREEGKTVISEERQTTVNELFPRYGEIEKINNSDTRSISKQSCQQMKNKDADEHPMNNDMAVVSAHFKKLNELLGANESNIVNNLTKEEDGNMCRIEYSGIELNTPIYNNRIQSDIPVEDTNSQGGGVSWGCTDSEKNAANDNASNDNASNDNATNDNAANDNAANDNAANDNAANDNAANDNAANDNSANDNLTCVPPPEKEQLREECSPMNCEEASENLLQVKLNDAVMWSTEGDADEWDKRKPECDTDMGEKVLSGVDEKLVEMMEKVLSNREEMNIGKVAEVERITDGQEVSTFEGIKHGHKTAEIDKITKGQEVANVEGITHDHETAEIQRIANDQVNTHRRDVTKIDKLITERGAASEKRMGTISVEGTTNLCTEGREKEDTHKGGWSELDEWKTPEEQNKSLQEREKAKESTLLNVYMKNILKEDVKNFETKINNLNQEQLKKKILEMFIGELISEKYMDILMKEEKGILKKILTIKYNSIFLKKKKKLQKELKKCMIKKLKKEKNLLKENYEKKKENFEIDIMNKTKEEIDVEKKKIENTIKEIEEKYLKKMNVYATDINMIKDIFSKEQIKKMKLQSINDIQHQVVYLQNCIIHDLSIEPILNDLKKNLEKDMFLFKVLKILPENFFSRTFKPTNNNNEKMKKEFYTLYKVSVKEAFLQQNDNFFKNITSTIMSYLYIHHESKVNMFLLRTLKENSPLKENLLNLSYALNSIQENKFIDALEHIDGLTGNCKHTFTSFNEKVKNAIFFKLYLRLTVSRLLLTSKILRTCY
ncbi:conserved Plasmodium protein, unknown function [Plasmodium ovale curtisi]|uniref:Uncharacterized protein n=1 Tax=Plasmodium ovale curtisi TaxID=864141 RepID=A0A1A8W496_PLAOA|nr:conserved Plasmodium protein, unknown function [Plasmodium ovale curtisi]